MSFRTTGVLAAVFAILLAYMYFTGTKKSSTTAENPAKKVFPLDKKKVTGLSVERQDTTVVIRKEGGEWRILKPVETAGSASSIDGLIRTLNDMQKTQVVADSAAVASGKTKLADFGLTQPKVRVGVTEEGEKPDTLLVGDTSPTGDYVYVARTDHPGVMATGNWQKNALDKGLFDLRDRRVVPFKTQNVKKFTVEYGHHLLEMSRESGSWKLVKPVAARADSRVIDRMLTRLHSAQVQRFVAEKATDPKAYGLDHPTMKVTLYEGEGLAQKTLIFGKEFHVPTRPDRRGLGQSRRMYARYLSRNPVLAVDTTLATDLRKTASDVRFKEIFAFDTSQIDHVVLTYPDSTVACQKDTSGSWETTQPKFRLVLDGEVQDMLNRVRRLKVDRFVAEKLTNPAQYGFEHPAVDARFLKGSQVVRDFTVGRKGGHTYVKSNAWPQVVEMKPTVMKALHMNMVSVKPGTSHADTLRVGSGKAKTK